VSERASHRFLFVGTGGREGWFGAFGFGLLFRIACYLAMSAAYVRCSSGWGFGGEFAPGCQVTA
jgi:hypothetical protein